jgi:hypothetical protein
MDLKPLPLSYNRRDLTQQAKKLIASFKSRERKTLGWLRRYHPRLPGRADTNDRNGTTDSEVRNAGLTLDEAELIIARMHQFESRSEFARHIEELKQPGSAVRQFELAADAITTGDVPTLKQLLRTRPELIRARSTREHHATLLHYVGANAVESYRQKTPKNAVQIAKVLLKARAVVDADLAYSAAMQKVYPERRGSTTLGLIATSVHPAQAGVQIDLLRTLLDAGASVNGLPGGWNPLIAALHNGRGAAAHYLTRRGARLDLEGAAGVGRLDVVKSFFKKDGGLKARATRAQMEAGFIWACEYGRPRVVAYLLEKGLDVTTQPHGETGLHWASYSGHFDIVESLLKRKAPVDTKDKRFEGTPLGWALYGWCDPPPESRRSSYYKVIATLVRAGAKVDPAWLDESKRGIPLAAKVQADRRMVAAMKAAHAP